MTTNGKQRRVRRNFFVLLLATTLSVYGMVDYCNLYDECLTMYWMEVVIAATCGTLYIWWWYSSGIASDVYRWLTLLFFAQVIRLLGNILARTAFLETPGGQLIASAPSNVDYLWTFRNFPELLVLLFMLSLILARLYCNVPNHNCLHTD